MTEHPDGLTLAIDTSGGTQVALIRGEQVVARAAHSDARGHAENLAPLIADVLAEAGLSSPEVTRVVVGTGPAPFTGLRVGLVTAAAFAAARGVPLHGVPSLEGWALASQGAGAGDTAEVRVVTDARRREIYTARYAYDDDAAGGLRVLEQPRVVAPGELAGALADERAAGVAVVGPGLYPDLLGPSGGTFDPAALAVLAAGRVAAGLPTPAEPLYLRRPDVHGVPGSAA